MENRNVTEKESAPTEHAELMSALFAQLVLQQTNMAMMLLGRSPDPQTGQVVQDVDAAKFFIDQLEMLEFKTRGNLNREEDQLLKQSLMALRLAFVEAVESPVAPAQARAEKPSPAPAAETAQGAAAEQSSGPAATETPAGEEAGRKKFVKKY